MRVGFIGDISGSFGREIIASNLQKLKELYMIDFVVANYENASHGVGLVKKHANELLSYGIDVMTGGNHTWDKKDILNFIDILPILKPLNSSPLSKGRGFLKVDVLGKEVVVISLMGHYTMGLVDNPFPMIVALVDKLKREGIKHIIIDFHAESTAEKYTMLYLLKEKVSAILGTHTHVGTDDLQIFDGCCFVSDVGLTGCRDQMLGVNRKEPIERSLFGYSEAFRPAKKCKTILQMILFTLNDDGRTIEAKKIKLFGDNGKIEESISMVESDYQ